VNTFGPAKELELELRRVVRSEVRVDPVLHTAAPYVRVILPVLVVPAGMLWQVDYGADGTVQKPPREVSRSNLFLNHTWSVETGHLGETFSHRLSHIELVTADALSETMESYFAAGGMF
jgi:hypothetical protein